MTKSPLAVAREALAIGQRSLPTYASKFSRKDYTLPQLFALLVLRKREHFRQQIDHLQDALQLAQEVQNKAMLLLENNRAGGGQFEKAIQKLETQIANQKAEFESRVGELKAEAKQEAIAEIKDKPWWQVVFS